MQHKTHIILNQPAVKSVIAFAVGIYIANRWSIPLPILFYICAILSGLILITFIFHTLRASLTSLRSLLILLLISLLGMFWSEYQVQSIPSSIIQFADSRESIRVIGIVQEDPVIQPDKIRTVIQCRYILIDSSKIPVSGLALLVYNKNTFIPTDSLNHFSIGDILEINGKIRLPRDQRNPGEFDYQKYLLAQNIVVLISATGGSKVRPLNATSSLRFDQKWMNTLRKEIRKRIQKFFSQDHAAFISGLLLGDYSTIDNSIIDAFTTAGVIHVLSVSGLHVGMILIIIIGVLGRFPMGIRSMLIIPLLLLYMMLTGSAPPVMRAVITAIVFFLGMVFQKQNSSVNSLSFAALVLLILQPLNLFLVSFQLSFAGVYSLLLFYPRIQSLIKFLPAAFLNVIGVRPILDIFGLTLAAQIGSAPFIFSHFGRFSIAAFIANIFVIPSIFIVTAASITLILISYIWTLPALLLAETTRVVLLLIIWFTKWIASIPLASIEVTQPTLLECTLYAAIIFYLFSATKPKILFRLFFVILCFGSFFSMKMAFEKVFPPHPTLRITMIDVSQGDAIDIELPSQKHILIDTGPRTYTFDTGEKIILPYYKRNGIHELAGLILTHPDNDHIGGTVSILHSMNVQHVWMSHQQNTSSDLEKIDSCLSFQNKKIDYLHRGDVISIDPDVRIYILHPCNDSTNEMITKHTISTNNRSVVLLIVYGKTKFLFTGDVEQEGEDQMIHAFGNVLQTDVLKVGHHGSTTCSTPKFLVDVKPKIALISCGKLNKFNHPSNLILTRLKLLHTQVHRTDKEGAVILESDGYSVKCINWK